MQGTFDFFLFIRLKVSQQLLNRILETLAEVDRMIVYFIWFTSGHISKPEVVGGKPEVNHSFEYFDFESAEYKPWIYHKCILYVTSHLAR